jgi:putative acetyltransferase
MHATPTPTDLFEIRKEKPEDYKRVFEVNSEAFETDVEAKLIDAVRPVARPLISLVATLRERIVGHILFTPVTVENAPEAMVTMALGPMAVIPSFQRRGAGSLLVQAGLRECKALSTAVVFVVGYPEYYGRFGFQFAAPLGLRFKSSEFDPYFMALENRPGMLESISGDVHYLPEFEGP